MSSASESSSIAQLTSLIGDRTVVLHAPEMEEWEAGLSGGDIDCVVQRIDPMWPLRLTDGWRLCQAFRYDLRGWYWVLQRGGEMLAFDTTDDPWGLGRDAIRTESFLAAMKDAPAPALRAAYLTIKRVRKQDLTGEEWARIGKLANVDREAFEAVLFTVAGAKLSGLLGPAALAGVAPDVRLVRRANERRYLRRFGSPERALRAILLGAQRYFERIGRPTGVIVLIGGPDGSGKSTLAQALPSLLHRTVKRSSITHWRPGLLPTPGRLVGAPVGDPARPHAREPHGRALSVALLAYHWFDFVLGNWLRDQPVRIRTGLVVRERGWWDLVVDPRRYRLTVSPTLVRTLGLFLKRPDVAVILEARPEVLLSRKAELSAQELARQMTVWRSALPAGVQQIHIDASRSPAEVAGEVQARLRSFLEARAIARLGAGWVNLPGRDVRWWIPRGPRSMAVSGLSIYQPVTRRGRFGWRAARAVAAVGGFRGLPRGAGPPKPVRTAVAEFVPPHGSLAAARSNRRGRFVAVVLDRRGRGVALAKVAADESSAAALRQEAASIERFGGLLPEAVRAPRVIGLCDRALLLEFMEHRAREEPWRLHAEVADALGSFFGSGKHHGDGRGLLGPAHGDFAPWNLLRTDDGWGLVDWESATDQAEPFHDLCHYIVQAHALLGRPTRGEIMSGFADGRGWVGEAVTAYSHAADLSASDASSYLRSYLVTSYRSLRATTANERRALLRRSALRRSLDQLT